VTVVLNLDRCRSCGKFYSHREDAIDQCLKCWSAETLERLEALPSVSRILAQLQ